MKKVKSILSAGLCAVLVSCGGGGSSSGGGNSDANVTNQCLSGLSSNVLRNNCDFAISVVYQWGFSGTSINSVRGPVELSANEEDFIFTGSIFSYIGCRLPSAASNNGDEDNPQFVCL